MLLGVLGLVLGVAVVCYPYASDLLNKRAQAAVMSAQDSVVARQSDEGIDRELQAAHAYNERVLDSRTTITDPFDPARQPPNPSEYAERLNLAGDGVMGTLRLPTVGLSMPIYHGTADDVLRHGVGHLDTTSLPVGGPSTHSVLAGHNGLPSVRIFDDLPKLKDGDLVVLHVLGRDMGYRVTGVETVLPSETDSLVIKPGADLLTLVTCVPYGVNSHRLLVHCERCDLPPDWDAQPPVSTAPSAPSALVPPALVGGAVAAGILLARHVARSMHPASSMRGRESRHGRRRGR